MSPRILVTGGTGLLGAYLLRWFIRQGYTQLTATYQQAEPDIPEDLKDGIQWKRIIFPDLQNTFELIEGQDWVIHCAGMISYDKQDKSALLAVNQEGTKHIVNACLEHDVNHFIYISSIGALGKEKNFAKLDESTPWLQNEYSTTYGLSKYLGELEAWRGAAEGLRVSTILPSVILGSGDWHRSSLQIIDRVANKPGWYPGGQTGYVDVRDIAHFIGRLLEENRTGDRWILNAENIPYGKIYALIGDSLGLDKTFRQAPKWLAKIILLAASLRQGKKLGFEILNHAYGSFEYDSSRSLTMDGFRYRPMAQTIHDIAALYKAGEAGQILSF